MPQKPCKCPKNHRQALKSMKMPEKNPKSLKMPEKALKPTKSQSIGPPYIAYFLLANDNGFHDEPGLAWWAGRQTPGSLLKASRTWAKQPAPSPLPWFTSAKRWFFTFILVHSLGLPRAQLFQKCGAAPAPPPLICCCQWGALDPKP